jgi:hypothetical protein
MWLTLMDLCIHESIGGECFFGFFPYRDQPQEQSRLGWIPLPLRVFDVVVCSFTILLLPGY